MHYIGAKIMLKHQHSALVQNNFLLSYEIKAFLSFQIGTFPANLLS